MGEIWARHGRDMGEICLTSERPYAGMDAMQITMALLTMDLLTMALLTMAIVILTTQAWTRCRSPSPRSTATSGPICPPRSRSPSSGLSRCAGTRRSLTLSLSLTLTLTLTLTLSLTLTLTLTKVCWEADPKKRPPFGRILDSLRAIGRTMERSSSGAASSAGDIHDIYGRGCHLYGLLQGVFFTGS